jgi:hypothetical protein
MFCFGPLPVNEKNVIRCLNKYEIQHIDEFESKCCDNQGANVFLLIPHRQEDNRLGLAMIGYEIKKWDSNHSQPKTVANSSDKKAHKLKQANNVTSKLASSLIPLPSAQKSPQKRHKVQATHRSPQTVRLSLVVPSVRQIWVIE